MDIVIKEQAAFEDELDKLYRIGEAVGCAKERVDEMLSRALDHVNEHHDRDWRRAIADVRRHLM